MLGTPVWVVAHGVVLCVVERDSDGLEGGVIVRGVSEPIPGADGFALRATDGGLRPPPASSVEPRGIPTAPTDEPGPMDEAIGGAVADAIQAPGALAVTLPPSKGVVLDSPGIESPMPADAPVI